VRRVCTRHPWIIYSRNCLPPRVVRHEEIGPSRTYAIACAIQFSKSVTTKPALSWTEKADADCSLVSKGSQLHLRGPAVCEAKAIYVRCSGLSRGPAPPHILGNSRFSPTPHGAPMVPPGIPGCTPQARSDRVRRGSAATRPAPQRPGGTTLTILRPRRKTNGDSIFWR